VVYLVIWLRFIWLFGYDYLVIWLRSFGYLVTIIWLFGCLFYLSTMASPTSGGVGDDGRQGDYDYVAGGNTESLDDKASAEELEEQLSKKPVELEDGDDEEVKADDDDDDEEEGAGAGSDSALQAVYVVAKSLVACTNYKKTRRTGGKDSSCWPFYQVCKIREPSLKNDLMDSDSEAHDKLQLAEDAKECYLVCRICFDNPDCALKSALIKPSFKNGLINGTGNLSSHLNNKHREIWDSAKKVKGYVYSNPWTAAAPSPATPTTQHTQPTASLAGTASQQAASELKSPPGKAPPKLVNLYNLATTTGEQRILETFQGLVHNFANHNDIPERVITRHDQCPEFRLMMQYALDNAKVLNGKPNLFPGQHRFQTIRKKLFDTLTAAVNQLARRTNQFWADFVGHRIAAFNFGQDVWESNKKDVLGGTIFVLDPVSGKYEMIPLILAFAESKKSQELFEQTVSLLETFGIEQKDLYKPTNDTTNASVKIGNLLTGEDGTCCMHTMSLLLNHAVGQLTRKVRGKVTDSFPEAVNVRKAAMESAAWLNNNKSKSRYHKFVEMMNQAGRTAKKLVMPNSTRAAGTVLLYQSLLEQRWNLEEYFHKNSEAKELSDENFWKVSQLHGILYPLMVLIKQLQTDRFGAISYTYYLIIRVLVMYLSKRKWWFTETRRKHVGETANRWDGCAAWPMTDYGFTPFDYDKERNEVAGGINRVGMVCLRKNDPELDQDLTPKLIRRIINEFPNYGAVASNNHLLAIAVNPFAATTLMSDLETMDSLLQQLGPDDRTKNLLKDIKQRAKQVLIDEIRKVWGDKVKSKVAGNESGTINTGSTNADGGSNDDDDDDDDDNLLEQMRRKRRKKSEDPNRSKDPVIATVDEFFSQNFNPRYVLGSQQNHVLNAEQTIGIDSEDWLMNVETIAKHFDLAEWWLGTGKKQFPLLFPIACCILALPDSNGHQERTFSAATWMDGKLNSKQNDITFQMKVLCYKNKDFLQRSLNMFKEDEMKEAEQKTKALLKKHIGAKKEEEITPDYEALMEEYSIDDVEN